MHELSIALSVLEIAEKNLDKSKVNVVKEIELDVGTLSGVEIESLKFALDSVIQNTEFVHTQFVINHLKAKAICLNCNFEYEMLHRFDACPNCQSYGSKIIQGTELKVRSILVE